MMNPSDKPLPESEIAGVLYVGETRARLLAEAGICTMDDLRAADAERIGSVKGVGLKNGHRIKEWLAAHESRQVPAIFASTKQGTTPAAEVSHEGINPDGGLAIANQTVQDDSWAINAAFTRIQQALPQGVAHRKFDRQVDKLLSVLSELAEAADTLRPKQYRRAVKMMHLIAALLDKFSAIGTFSEKIVLAFAEELRDRRRRLQDILDPKR